MGDKPRRRAPQRAALIRLPLALTPCGRSAACTLPKVGLAPTSQRDSFAKAVLCRATAVPPGRSASPAAPRRVPRASCAVSDAPVRAHVDAAPRCAWCALPAARSPCIPAYSVIREVLRRADAP
eukprot:199091-Chlamydomonas_euryale.AAC.8